MRNWYKILSVILILYTLVWGLLGSVPRLDILNETIRNVYFHVPIWFAMLFMMSVSLFYSIKTLMSNSLLHDSKAYDSALTGFFFSLPGITTG
ncbi:MAG: ABC transporter permease, partial [Bacteroidia bacterium]